MNYAREVYEFAWLEFEEAFQQAHDLGLKTADGAQALQNAVVQYQYRFRQYELAVNRFADCLLTGAILGEGQVAQKAA